MHFYAGVAQLARASAFQADCREFESRLPLQYKIDLVILFIFIFFTKSDAGVAQLARASAFQADCREFESRLPLHCMSLDKMFFYLNRGIEQLGSSSGS